MKLYLLFSLLLITHLLNSQDNQYISLAVGPSIPLSSFGRMDLNDSTSGWAKTGVALEFTYAYRLTKVFGFQGKVTYSSNKFDSYEYGDKLTRAFSINNEDPDTSFSVESSKNWGSGGFLIGPFVSLPLSESLRWDIKALVGFFGTNSPTTTTYGNIDTGEQLEEYYRQGGRGYAFAYSLGTGLKYKLAKYYALLFIDYFNSKVEISNVSGVNWNAEPYKTSFKQDISFLSVTFGLGYFF